MRRLCDIKTGFVRLHPVGFLLVFEKSMGMLATVDDLTANCVLSYELLHIIDSNEVLLNVYLLPQMQFEPARLAQLVERLHSKQEEHSFHSSEYVSIGLRPIND